MFIISVILDGFGISIAPADGVDGGFECGVMDILDELLLSQGYPEPGCGHGVLSHCTVVNKIG